MSVYFFISVLPLRLPDFLIVLLTCMVFADLLVPQPICDPRFTVTQMMFYGKQGILFLVPSCQVELSASATHGSTALSDVMIGKYCTNLQEKMHQQHYWKIKSKLTVENLCLILPLTFWLPHLLLSLKLGHLLFFSYIQYHDDTGSKHGSKKWGFHALFLSISWTGI